MKRRMRDIKFLLLLIALLVCIGSTDAFAFDPNGHLTSLGISEEMYFILSMFSLITAIGGQGEITTATRF